MRSIEQKATAATIQYVNARSVFEQYRTSSEYSKKFLAEQGEDIELYRAVCDDFKRIVATIWLIPKTAEKPIDGRTKKGKELKHE